MYLAARGLVYRLDWPLAVHLLGLPWFRYELGFHVLGWQWAALNIGRLYRVLVMA
jgi:hypothetical protein